MEHTGRSIFAVAFAAVGLMLPALALPAPSVAVGGARHRHATLPGPLVTLEQKMLRLHLDTDRLAVKLIEKEPQSKASGVFEVLPRKHLSTKQGRRIVKRTELAAIVEQSKSSSLTRVRERFGPLRLELRRIGDKLYEHAPFLEKLDGDHPWIERTRSEVEGRRRSDGLTSSSEFDSSQYQEFVQIDRLFSGAKSVRILGTRSNAKARASGFEAALSPRAAFANLFAERARGTDGKLLQKLKRRLAKLTVRLRVWFDDGGLPVEMAFAFGHGRDWTIETTRFLATEEPVSVLAPPAGETITAAKLKKDEKEVREEAKETPAARIGPKEREGGEISGGFAVEPADALTPDADAVSRGVWK